MRSRVQTEVFVSLISSFFGALLFYKMLEVPAEFGLGMLIVWLLSAIFAYVLMKRLWRVDLPYGILWIPVGVFAPIACILVGVATFTVLVVMWRPIKELMKILFRPLL